MNVDHILGVFNAHGVQYILIGGMNFLLRHAPQLTYDVDLWVDRTPENLRHCETALTELQAEWGPTENDWRPVAEWGPDWLRRQSVFALTSPSAAIDIFLSVTGLDAWQACRARAETGTTSGGVAFVGLSDADMLACQLALPEGERKLDRINALRSAIARNVP